MYGALFGANSATLAVLQIHPNTLVIPRDRNVGTEDPAEQAHDALLVIDLRLDADSPLPCPILYG